jgi:hypothetical protein
MLGFMNSLSAEAKHTSGAWKVRFLRWNPNGPVTGFVIEPSGEDKWSEIAGNKFYGQKNNACYSSEELVANGNLISAAPDLLEALRAFMDMWGSGDAGSASKRAQQKRADMWEKANAAIAKVEGRA